MKKTKYSDLQVLLALGLGVAMIHAFTNGQYGFHRDELDIIMNARQLAWGYVAYPPFTPLIARLGLILFGPSLIGLRLFSAVAQGVVTVLVGWMAKDMGGNRTAQVVAALAVFISPLAMTCGTLIQYMSFDYLWWVVIAFFTVRLLATGNPRYWLGIGASIGMGMMTKFTLAYFIAGLVLGILLTPMRRYLRTPWPWIGAGIAVLIFSPEIVWQIQHNFVSIDFLKSIHARDIAWGRANGYLIDQLYASAHPVTLPLWIAGLVACLFSRQETRFRALGWMYLVPFVLFLVSQGRGYYIAPAYPMLLAAGSVWLVNWLDARSEATRRWGMGVVWGALATGGLVILILVKPVMPINSPLWNNAIRLSDIFVEMVGWQDLTREVAQVYNDLPEINKPGTVILAGNYGEAGALELYGPEYNLPLVVSGGNSMWARGYGDTEWQSVVLVGFESQYASQYFKSCHAVGKVTNQYGVKNEESAWHNILYVCRQPRKPWAEVWPSMQWFQ